MARVKNNQPAKKTPRGSLPPATSSQSKSAKKTTITNGGVKRVAKYKPGIVSLRQIRKYQASTDLLIPKAPFSRLVREIAQDYLSDIRFTKNALLATQEATEAYLVRLLECGQLAAIHANRVTLMPKDISLVLRVRDDEVSKTICNLLDMYKHKNRIQKSIKRDVFGGSAKTKKPPVPETQIDEESDDDDDEDIAETFPRGDKEDYIHEVGVSLSKAFPDLEEIRIPDTDKESVLISPEKTTELMEIGEEEAAAIMELENPKTPDANAGPDTDEEQDDEDFDDSPRAIRRAISEVPLPGSPSYNPAIDSEPSQLDLPSMPERPPSPENIHSPGIVDTQNPWERYDLDY